MELECSVQGNSLEDRVTTLPQPLQTSRLDKVILSKCTQLAPPAYATIVGVDGLIILGGAALGVLAAQACKYIAVHYRI